MQCGTIHFQCRCFSFKDKERKNIISCRSKHLSFHVPQIWPVCIFVASCRTFTVTAVAQLCVLGTMWIFGCFQFGESTIIMSYLFTIFGSLQGFMLFVMHCLFSKQVGYNPLNKKGQTPLLFLASKLNLHSDFRWGKSMEISCPEYVHLRRRHTQSSVARTPAKLM